MNAILLSIALAAATPRAPAPDALHALLLTSPRPDTLRARLARHAARTSRSREAALAHYYRGLSFDRGARADSAIASYRRALELQPAAPARYGLVDVLLRRRKPEDVQEAIRLLASDSSGEERSMAALEGGDPARLAWAYALSGDARRAREMLKPLEAELGTSPKWRFRLASIFVAADDPQAAVPLLEDLTVTSRGYDEDAMRLLDAVVERVGESAGKAIRERIDQLLRDRNTTEGERLTRLGGRLVRFGASDGATVGAYLFADSAARARRPAAIVLRAPGDALAGYDSLVTDLRNAGLAVLLVDPRGTGWSVDSRVPQPETWEGREEALETRVERDARDAIGVFGRLARIDTTRCLLVGVGSMAPVVVTVASRDRRVGALGLIDPLVSPVERGAVVAGAAGRTAYLQIGGGDVHDQAFVAALVRSLDPARTLRVDAGPVGRGVEQFSKRPALRAEFVGWASRVARDRTATRRPPPRSR